MVSQGYGTMRAKVDRSIDCALDRRERASVDGAQIRPDLTTKQVSFRLRLNARSRLFVLHPFTMIRFLQCVYISISDTLPLKKNRGAFFWEENAGLLLSMMTSLGLFPPVRREEASLES